MRKLSGIAHHCQQGQDLEWYIGLVFCLAEFMPSMTAPANLTIYRLTIACFLATLKPLMAATVPILKVSLA
jgi:hypothetical protein